MATTKNTAARKPAANAKGNAPAPAKAAQPAQPAQPAAPQRPAQCLTGVTLAKTAVQAAQAVSPAPGAPRYVQGTHTQARGYRATLLGCIAALNAHYGSKGFTLGQLASAVHVCMAPNHNTPTGYVNWCVRNTNMLAPVASK